MNWKQLNPGLFLLIGMAANPASGITNSYVPAEFSIATFSDEFSGTALDTSRWSAKPAIWRTPEATRPELQALYRNYAENSTVGNGHLLLKTLNEDVTGDGTADWTSAIIIAKPMFNQRFGYYESRFKVTAAPSQNNAFWLLSRAPVHDHGTESWEIDFQENGYPTRQNSNWYNHTKPGVSGHHSLSATGLAALGITDLSTEYITYGCDWATDHTMKIYLNGSLIHTFGSEGTLTSGAAITNLTADLWGNADSAFGLGSGAASGAGVSGSSGLYATGTNGTVTFLFKTPSAMSGFTSLFNQGGYADSSQFEVGINNGQLRLGTQNGATKQLNYIGVLATDTWYYFGMRWDRAAASDDLDWYYGVAGDSALNTGSLTISSSGDNKPIYVAGRSGSVPFLGGFFQHVAVYERTLSAASIQAQFDATAVSGAGYDATVGTPSDGGAGPSLWYKTARSPNAGSAAGGGPEFQRAESMRGSALSLSTLPFLGVIDGYLNNGSWTQADLDALHGTAMDVDWVRAYQKPGWIGLSSDWSAEGNWGPDGIPGAGHAALFNQGTSQTNVSFAADLAVQELSFQGTNVPAMVIAGPGTLELGALVPGSNNGIGGIGMTFNVLESQTIHAGIEAQRKLRFVNLAGAPEYLGGSAEGLGAQLILNGSISAVANQTPIEFFNLGGIVVNGAIGSQIGSLKKDSQGTLELNASNSFTGELELRDGIVLVNADGALGGTNGPTVVYPSSYEGSLVFGNVDYTMLEPVILHGAGANNNGFEPRAGAIDVEGATTAARFAGPITLGSDASIGCKASGASLHLSGRISLDTNTLVFAGAGTIRLAGSVIGTGSVVVDSGLAFVVDSGSITIGGVLDLSGAVLDVEPGPGGFTLPVYILATASSIVGTPALANPLPPDYVLDTAYGDGNQLALVRDTPYDHWSALYFPGSQNEEEAQPDGDPDLDKASNLSEFAFGSNPTNADSQFFEGWLEAGFFRILFLQRSDGSMDYTVRTSTNLIQGFSGTIPSQPSGTQPGGLPVDYEQAEASVPAAESQVFMKVEAQMSE